MLHHSDIPYKLITLLSNPNILKVGVNAIGDGFALNMARAGRSAGLVELSSIVSLVYAREEKGNGLRDLTRKLLGLDLRKGIFKKRGEGFVKRWERGLTEKEKTCEWVVDLKLLKWMRADVPGMF